MMTRALKGPNIAFNFRGFVVREIGRITLLANERRVELPLVAPFQGFVDSR